MAESYADQFHYVVPVPAGTLQANPQITALAMPPRTVTRIDWRVPPGPQGNMGFLVGINKVPALPLPTGTYVVADGNSGDWQIEGFPDSGAWTCIAYNTGTFQHSVYLTFHTKVIMGRTAPRELLAAPLLAPMPDLAAAGPPIRRR